MRKAAYATSCDNVPESAGRHREILTARQRLKAQTLRRRACYNRGESLRGGVDQAVINQRIRAPPANHNLEGVDAQINYFL